MRYPTLGPDGCSPPQCRDPCHCSRLTLDRGPRVPLHLPRVHGPGPGGREGTRRRGDDYLPWPFTVARSLGSLKAPRPDLSIPVTSHCGVGSVAGCGFGTPSCPIASFSDQGTMHDPRSLCHRVRLCARDDARRGYGGDVSGGGRGDGDTAAGVGGRAASRPRTLAGTGRPTTMASSRRTETHPS